MKKSELYEKTVQFTHAEALLWLAAIKAIKMEVAGG